MADLVPQSSVDRADRGVSTKAPGRSVLLVVLPYLLGDATTRDTSKKGARSFLAFPYGVLTVASYIRRYAENLDRVEVLDLNLPSHESADAILMRSIETMKPDIVGFSMSSASIRFFRPTSPSE